MSDSWDYKEQVITTKSWVRSPSQTFQTGLGTEFRLVAEMEKVSILENGTILYEQLPSVIRSMSQVYQDPRVQQLAALLKELCAEWRLEQEKKDKTGDEQPITDVNFDT